MPTKHKMLLSKYWKLLSSIDTHQCRDLRGITILIPVGVGSLIPLLTLILIPCIHQYTVPLSSLPSQGVTYQMGDHVKADYSILRIRVCCIQVLDFIIVSALKRGYKHGNVSILLLPVRLFKEQGHGVCHVLLLLQFRQHLHRDRQNTYELVFTVRTCNFWEIIILGSDKFWSQAQTTVSFTNLQTFTNLSKCNVAMLKVQYQEGNDTNKGEFMTGP